MNGAFWSIVESGKNRGQRCRSGRSEFPASAPSAEFSHETGSSEGRWFGSSPWFFPLSLTIYTTTDFVLLSGPGPEARAAFLGRGADSAIRVLRQNVEERLDDVCRGRELTEGAQCAGGDQGVVSDASVGRLRKTEENREQVGTFLRGHPADETRAVFVPREVPDGDLASVITLANELRAELVEKGLVNGAKQAAPDLPTGRAFQMLTGLIGSGQN